ncbi:MAG: hypothetical protein FD143_1279 [Ignavibacteria bacterium]|nr:MAG: hypothetical protein FD143_1279 [Ignavibacteria bacterium]KAF0160796.1 MAG: hypothetical protein FD188_1401 [Ignavibacteria bacterium]
MKKWFEMELGTSIKILLVEDAYTMSKMEIKTLGSLDFKNVLEATSELKQ